MNDEMDIEQIHRYLSGNMETSEQEAFAAAVTKDAALEQAVLLERQLLGALEQSFDEQARQDIGQVHRQLEEQGFFETANNNAGRRLTLRIAAAAAMIVLCAGIWWFALKPDIFQPELAYREYFQPETVKVEGIINGLTSVGFTPEMNQTDSLREALIRYRDGSYQQAGEALGFFLKDHPQNDTARFYLALAELSLSQFEPAVNKLSSIASQGWGGMEKEVQWYLALSYLRMEGRLKEARQILERLAQDDDFDKQAEALKLVTEMKK